VSGREREAFGFEMKVIVLLLSLLLYFMCDKVIAIIKLFSLNSFEVENENLIELFQPDFSLALNEGNFR
jgi:hypothetical protein